MPDLHPYLVHFPIAWMVGAFLFDAAAWLTGRSDLAGVARWALILGGGAALLAALSGLLATHHVVDGADPQRALNRHQSLAFLALLTALGAAWVRFLIEKNPGPNARFRCLLWSGLAAVAVIAAAWSGGVLVYHYGSGVTLP